MYFKEVLILSTLIAVLVCSPLIEDEQVVPQISDYQQSAWEDDTAAVVKFHDRIVEPNDALQYSQQFHVLIRKIGEKHTKIILNIPGARVELFKLTLNSIFFKAAADENGIREREELEKIKIFLYIPVKSFHDRKSLQDIQILAVGLVNYIANEGIVSGVIFETSLIQNPIPAEGGGSVHEEEVTAAMTYTVAKFKKFLKSLQLTFGHELEMGMAVNLNKECVNLLVGDCDEMVASFDMIVLTGSFKEEREDVWGNEGQKEFFGDCVKGLQKKFKHLGFYYVGEFFDFKN